MYTTSKKSKMVSELEIEIDESKRPKLKAIQTIEGRVVALCLTTWYFGYVFCEMSPLNPSLVVSPQFGGFAADIRGTGLCFGLVPIGAAAGVAIATGIIDKLSRRTLLVILNILNLLVTGLIQIGDVETLFIFRFFQGVLVGLFMTLIPTYIGELTPKELGSRFGVYPQISVVLGVLVAYLIGNVIFTNCFNLDTVPAGQTIPNWQVQTFWRVQLAIPLLPSLIQLLLVAIGYIPESPHSLILKNRKDTAREVLALFYEEAFVDQLVQDRESAIFNKKTELDESKITWTTKGYTIGWILAIMQVLTGIASFVTQAGHVLSFTFNQPYIGQYTPILITISQLIGTFISIPMLKYFEWRKMTIIGGFAIAFFDAMNGMLFYLAEQYKKEGNTSGLNYTTLMACICVMFFMFTFGMTLGSSVWPYIGFMMPPMAVTAASIVNWLLAGVTIIAFYYVTYCMGSPYVMLFIYCGVTFVLSIVFSCMSIDIKGLSVRKVQMHLQ